ncbi:hypothetical protein ACF0H5_016094 [Mactra antiquata]
MLQTCLFCLSLVTIATEQVWLQDLNSDLDRRHLEAGLPSTLNFRLSRRDASRSSLLDLKLEENTRLNANAPVFTVKKTPDGKQKLERKNSAPFMVTKFYQDKKAGGTFQVTCQNRKGGPCQRSLSGNLNISGRNYEIRPVPESPELPTLSATRDLHNEDDVPHVLIPSGEEMTRPNMSKTFTDAAEIPDRDNKPRSELLEELQALLSDEQKRMIEKKLAMKFSRTKRSSPVYALEIVIAVDNALWNRYFTSTSASNGLNQDESTELRLRQHFAHIINGASLRYESIEDPEMNIYLTISGFLFYKDLDSTNPYPPSSLPNIDGTEYCDADSYINNLISWSATLTDLPPNDHIAVFTGYELYSGSTSNTGVAGKAWVKGVCNSYRTSINEDTTYFTTVSVFAHELGHNLGSSHDGSSGSSGCLASDEYIMAPMVASFSPGEAYSVNPWRFSPCSVTAFKSYVDSMGSGNCLLDSSYYYDEQEYTDHMTLLPGELHSADEQCRLARGDNSYLCSSPTDEDICRVMMCKGDDGYCWYYAAARGTPCGETSQNKWCIDGQCVTRSDDHVGTVGSNSDNDNTGGSTNTGSGGGGSSGTVTNPPAQTTVNNMNSGCVNIGWQDWTCNDISEYFFDAYSLTPSQWCTDPNWYDACCAYCNGDYNQVITTTTTTTQAPVNDGCVDIGWSCASGPWTCQEVSDYFQSAYGYGPTSWCLDPNWKGRCCQFCAGYGI